MSLFRFGAIARIAILGFCLAADLAQAQLVEPPQGPSAGALMGSRVEFMLDLAEVSDVQRAQIKSILDAARNDLKPQQQNARALRQQAMTLFGAPTLDPAALEAVRQQQQLHHELVSKRMGQAMIAVAQVLTPEQRAKIASKLKQRAERAEHAASKP